jgi:hypothetical protein
MADPIPEPAGREAETEEPTREQLITLFRSLLKWADGEIEPPLPPPPKRKRKKRVGRPAV